MNAPSPGKKATRKLLIMFVLSLLPAFACFSCGRAIDCKPGQQDGQCGLTSFMGLLAGAATAVLINLIGLFVVLARFWREKR